MITSWPGTAGKLGVGSKLIAGSRGSATARSTTTPVRVVVWSDTVKRTGYSPISPGPGVQLNAPLESNEAVGGRPVAENVSVVLASRSVPVTLNCNVLPSSTAWRATSMVGARFTLLTLTTTSMVSLAPLGSVTRNCSG